MSNLRYGSITIAVGRQMSGGAVSLLGTGFAVGKKLIATAAHVTTQDDRDLKIIFRSNISLHDYQDTTNNTVQHISVKMHAFDPLHDICILQLSDGEFMDFFKISGTDIVLPGNTIATFGFPHADTGRLVLTQQTTTVGARIYVGASGLRVKHLVLNTQARPGQSGSPVVYADKVCAMITGGYAPNTGGWVMAGGVDTRTLHQTTHAVSAEYIKDMIK